MQTCWHEKTIDELLVQLGTNTRLGLSTQDAIERLAKIGANELHKGETVSPLAILLSQFHGLVIWVLVGAALVSVLLGEVVDGIAIIAIVLLNAVIGFFQEYRAARSRCSGRIGNKIWRQLREQGRQLG